MALSMKELPPCNYGTTVYSNVTLLVWTRSMTLSTTGWHRNSRPALTSANHAASVFEWCTQQRERCARSGPAGPVG